MNKASVAVLAVLVSAWWTTDAAAQAVAAGASHGVALTSGGAVWT